MVAGSLDESKVSSSEQADRMTILEALSETKLRGFPIVHHLSHGIEVVLAIKGNLDWSINPILEDISSLTTSFELFEVSHIPRALNLVAHSCTEKTYKGDRNMVFFGS